ncbi:hypothetical protein [Lactimicrobium massiliense]|uniref:hypothetical protein n=1 Tax=Lactimicrobium massiliense TaxID=2161814 RepID=UPI000D54CECC|nr:hypothetical protein [Lactimicrobium massiliense]
MKASYTFNIDKSQRKALAQTAGEFFQMKPEYKMPGCRFVLEGKAEIQRDGTMDMDESVSEEEAEAMLSYLADHGFTKTDDPEENSFTVLTDEEPQEEAEPEPESEDEEEPMELSLSLPDDLTDEAYDRLQTIIETKQELLKHAFQSDTITLKRENGQITFDGFPSIDSDHHKAFVDFVTLVTEFAKNATRVSKEEKEITSEKYSFRNFLLRLGMKGAEYKLTRKILLENLTGSAAFPTEEKAKAHAAKWAEKRKEAKEAEQEASDDADAE